MAQARQLVLGRTDAPFADATLAARWLREEEALGLGPDHVERTQRFHELVEIPISEIMRLVEDVAIGFSITVKPDVMFFRGGDGNVDSVTLPFGSRRLWFLRSYARPLAILQWGEWCADDPQRQADATMQLLIGRPAPKPLPRRRAKDVDLLGLVQQLGPPPRSPGRRGVDVGERTYWRRISEEWRRRYEARWGTYHWISAHRRYEELHKRGIHLPQPMVEGQ